MAKKTITSINPATLEINGTVEATPAGSVKKIVAAAREAQESWGALPFGKRLACLMKVQDALIGGLDDCAETITRDNGKTLIESLNADIYPVLDMFKFCATDAKRALQDERVSNPMFKIARIESGNVFSPRGVVGIISPWNFPFGIPMTQIISALIAGNAVVLKPAEITAWTGDLIRRLFETGGMPENVLQVIQGPGSVLGAEMMDARLDFVSFTGSVETGKKLMAKAADTLTPVTLELGGKDPFIVLEDADIERASSAAVWGAFINAGQVCASVERVYVHNKISDKFIRRVVEKTNKLRLGNGLDKNTDMGPMISEEQLEKVQAHISDADSHGAEILTGGNRASSLPGHFLEPTVLVKVNHAMSCVMEETFGPTLPIMTFGSDDEAVQLANDSKYGLAASVWSRNGDRARALARKIQSGTVVVNDCLFTYGFSQCPWGGVKESGIGRSHSVHGLLEFTNIKNITVSKSPLREDLWWYPYSQAKYDGMKAVMKTLYCEGIACKADGIAGIVKALKPRG